MGAGVPGVKRGEGSIGSIMCCSHDTERLREEGELRFEVFASTAHLWEGTGCVCDIAQAGLLPEGFLSLKPVSNIISVSAGCRGQGASLPSVCAGLHPAPAAHGDPTSPGARPGPIPDLASPPVPEQLLQGTEQTGLSSPEQGDADS